MEVERVGFAGQAAGLAKFENAETTTGFEYAMKFA